MFKLHKMPEENQSKGARVSQFKRRFLTVSLALVSLLLIAGLAYVQINSFYIKLQSSWEEIEFAYSKPELVKALRVEYTSRAEELDKSFMALEKTAEQKLIEEVTSQLKNGKK